MTDHATSMPTPTPTPTPAPTPDQVLASRRARLGCFAMAAIGAALLGALWLNLTLVGTKEPMLEFMIEGLRADYEKLEENNQALQAALADARRARHNTPAASGDTADALGGRQWALTVGTGNMPNARVLRIAAGPSRRVALHGPDGAIHGPWDVAAELVVSARVGDAALPAGADTDSILVMSADGHHWINLPHGATRALAASYDVSLSGAWPTSAPIAIPLDAAATWRLVLLPNADAPD